MTEFHHFFSSRIFYNNRFRRRKNRTNIKTLAYILEHNKGKIYETDVFRKYSQHKIFPFTSWVVIVNVFRNDGKKIYITTRLQSTGKYLMMMGQGKFLQKSYNGLLFCCP